MTVPITMLENHLEDLASDYYDLQFPAANQLDAPPTPLEALRMVSKGHPTVIQGFSPILEAGKGRDWRKPETYADIEGGEVTIAVTDDGLADSVRALHSGGTTFVKPLETRMAMCAFLDRLTTDDDDEALYLQSQDGNIYRSEPGPRGEPELRAFQRVVARDVAWMKEAVGSSAEAVNLWIGSSRSTTSFHHDPYENIYHVLSGSKTFTLLSPIDGLALDQRFHPPSTLVRSASGALVPQPDSAPAHPVPWVRDLDVPEGARPVTVHLGEGDTLYLPAGWWHRVDQGEGDGGLAVAVNYWYPADIRPERYALERFTQRVARTAGRAGVIPVDVDDDDDAHDDVWGSDGYGSGVDTADEWDPREWGR